jgi:heme/copper-type cytochrome/quinol oxidase subunit 2
MTINMKWKERASVAAVVLILLGLPVLLWGWRAVIVPHEYPPGSKIITLTATANCGIWTEEPIFGYNYWWRRPARTEDINLNQGDHVVVRVRSSDVLHSFAIPIMHIGPVDVPAGHTVTVQFDANRSGVLTFLCWQVCSPVHGNLHGRFVVKASGAGTDSGW